MLFFFNILTIFSANEAPKKVEPPRSGDTGQLRSGPGLS